MLAVTFCLRPVAVLERVTAYFLRNATMYTALVVDDSQVDRRLVGGLLNKTGEFEILYAEDGRDALERIESDLPDIVLTDLNMPGMTGLELVDVMQTEYPLIPVLLMTAQGSEELAVEALRRGAASYVSKRRMAEDMVPSVLHILDAAQQERHQTRLQNRIAYSQTIYELPNDTALVMALVQSVRENIRGLKTFAENDRLRLGIALEEALLNALYHGNLEVSSSLRDEGEGLYQETARERAVIAPFCHRVLKVEVTLSSQRVCFRIHDDGPGFDPASVPDPTDPEFLDRPSGRGMLLIRSFMDQVTYNETGNEVVMIKYAAAAEPTSDQSVI